MGRPVRALPEHLEPVTGHMGDLTNEAVPSGEGACRDGEQVGRQPAGTRTESRFRAFARIVANFRPRR